MSEEKAKNPRVDFDKPIVRGDSEITGVDLVCPVAGGFAGLNLRDIYNIEANVMYDLLPRITSPTLTRAEVMAMNSADFFALSCEASAFLLPRSVLPV